MTVKMEIKLEIDDKTKNENVVLRKIEQYIRTLEEVQDFYSNSYKED